MNLSPKETCRLLDIDPQTLRKMAREGRIDYVQLTYGGHKRYNVLSYMEDGAKRMPSDATAKKESLPCK